VWNPTDEPHAEAGVEALIYARAIHFAATLTVAGVAFFCVLIAEPAFRPAQSSVASAMVRMRLGVIAWIAFALSLVSGAAWLVVNTRAMSGSSLSQVFSDDVLGIVLTGTEFGRIWLLRFATACLLAIVLWCYLRVPRVKPGPIRSICTAAALLGLSGVFVASLAWAGHGAGGLNTEAIVHPAADAVHLLAATAWIGTLVPLAVLLAVIGRDDASVRIAQTATRRFSTLGIISVATLVVTGGINTWYLAGSIPALADTHYGHLLLAKIGLFLAMIVVAAVNRLDLLPKLAGATGPTAAELTLRSLRRNAVIEVLLGAIIIGIVAVLGTSPPGLHQMPMSPVGSSHHHDGP
jgi:copper resistance protein D